MQHDDVIWQVISHGHCSFKVKTTTDTFCRNAYNVTGLCNRSSCPLANSRYATIREHEGVLYLYMKTIERSHTPNQLWERLKLPKNYGKAIEIIDKHLEFWPQLLLHKVKQRLTKMTQYLIRMRKLALRVQPKLIPMPKKQVRREARREAKAEVAAKLDKAIEKELLQRLKSGTYGEIYNFPMKEYEKVLEMERIDEPMEEGEEEEEGAEKDMEGEEEEEEEEEEEPVVEYIEDYDLDEEEENFEEFVGYSGRKGEEGLEESNGNGEEEDGDEDDSEEERKNMEKKRRKREKGNVKMKTKRRPHIEVEYEEEREPLIASMN